VSIVDPAGGDGLDWDLPSYPVVPEKVAVPLKVKVDYGDLRKTNTGKP
jgi:hypothetical protein